MKWTAIESNGRNVSLIAFYGNKPPELINLIEQIQNDLKKELKEGFQPSSLPQIHGTVIGYEGIKTEQGILSYWFWKHRQEEKYINLSGSLDYILKTKRLPLKIRFGGYNPHIDYGFLSQNQVLFERSFQVLNNLAVLMGWPVIKEQVSLELAQLRLGFQSFNLLHKHHPKIDSFDNDFYLRLGTLKVQLSDEKLREIKTQVQNTLKVNLPLDLGVELKNLSFVAYEDPSLPIETTRILPFTETNLTQLELLYS
ncbi:hypothetical protein PCC7424_5221 [Gloeothece citriformis PCC 7424]|uniref:Uncharacterized protein n=1 Tax=Gloeothece citriformis (strain PCC 7424) TaxID=65393 RepID=B7KI82_GLOC7|nr:hypothetical protein [Gloeothece citriformis]ACK73569.1 hypothetical protein PCC7424_5221 [Gloeothece citriformis PCC 7424]